MNVRLLFVLIFIFLSFSYAMNVLEKVSLSGSTLELKFKKDLKPKEINYLTLEDPKREIFDFENSQIGDDIGSIDTDGMVKIAQNRPDRVRVVISGKLDSDARLSGNIYKIPLKINSSSSFESTSAESKKEIKNSSTKNIEYNELDSIFSGIQKAPKIKIEDCEVPTKKSKNSNNGFKSKEQFIKEPTAGGDVIVIDAGHGGKDPGAVSGDLQEKDVTLSVAKRLGRILANRGYKVYLTRDDDRFITLEQRTKMADKKDAKIFLSLHCNAAPNERAANNMKGIETFFLQRSKDARSQAIAARENASVLQGADKKSKQVIVDAVLCGPKIVLSNKLAIDIQNNLMKNLPTKDGGVRSAPFWVLVGASRPSVLVEMGYITHPEEGQMLFNDGYQSKIANGIADGVVRYLANQREEIGF